MKEICRIMVFKKIEVNKKGWSEKSEEFFLDDIHSICTFSNEYIYTYRYKFLNYHNIYRVPLNPHPL